MWRISILSAALVSGLTACQDTSGANDLDAAGLPDAALLEDVSTIPDGGLSDGGVSPEGVTYDFCDQVLFKLPIGGPEEDMFGITLWDGRLAYTRGPATSMRYELYLFDIADCTEYKLTTGAIAVEAFIHRSEIIYTDHADSRTEPDYHCADLHRYDLENWTDERLTDHPFCEWNPMTNGRHVGYLRSTEPGGGAPQENLLWDRQLGTEIQLAEPAMQAGYHDISERYVAWSAYTPLADSVGKDVFFYDLVTQQETHIEFTMPYFCYEVQLWGEYLTYTCSEYWIEPPYHLKLYHLPTGEELHLVGDGATEAGIGDGVIHEKLVMWNTTRHMSEIGIFEPNSDIELYDIDSGVLRRITTLESRLRIGALHFPYALVGRSLGSNAQEHYVLDLVQLGVVDAEGRVIPGDSVLDPPQ